MLVTSLPIMEQIVDENPELEWDGWNVVKYTKSHSAMYSKDGVYKNGQWYKAKVFPITEQGWNIPNSIRRSYAGVEN